MATKDNRTSGSLTYLAMKRFRKNRIAMSCMAVILLFCVLSVLGYTVMPDDTPMANRQMPELAVKKPGFSIQILKVRRNEEQVNAGILDKMMFGEKNKFNEYPVFAYKFLPDRLEAELYTGSEPNDGEIRQFPYSDIVYPLSSSFEKPNDEKAKHITDIDGHLISASNEEMRIEVEKNHVVKRTFLLGTDRFGRDMLSRMIAGTRISLAVGLISVTISVLIGVFLGALAGYFRGWIDDVIMWFVTVIWSVPLLLLVIAITLAMGKGFWQVFVAVGLAMWVDVARIVRGQVISIREKEFVEACRALGFSEFRTIFRHILPNISGPVIVVSAANFASAILIEAGLSFLGIGAQPPVPSWGNMIKDHYGYIIMDEAYLAIIPAFAIMVLVLALTLAGNGLRDALDVKHIEKQ